MKKVLRLKTEFERIIKRADEILIASAMITDFGLSLFDNRDQDALFQVLVGIDLPTQPLALQKMFDNKVEARVHNIKGQFFHPKVHYLHVYKQIINFCCHFGLFFSSFCYFTLAFIGPEVESISKKEQGRAKGAKEGTGGYHR